MNRNERGAALLSVLLLVSIMAVIAALAIDRLNVATRLAINQRGLDQARAHMMSAEAMSLLRLDEARNAADGEGDQITQYLGRTTSLPVNGAIVSVSIEDGGNCFNLNSVVSGRSGNFVRNAQGVNQLIRLLSMLEVGPQDAAIIAGSLVDWIDSDTLVGEGGAEDDYYQNLPNPYRTANNLLFDSSELRAIRGVNADVFKRLEPWVCALPAALLSPINVNSIRSNQAILLAMIFTENIGVDRWRSAIEARPSGGYPSAEAFLQTVGANISADINWQIPTKPAWYRLDINVQLDNVSASERVLIDGRFTKARIVHREWGSK